VIGEKAPDDGQSDWRARDREADEAILFGAGK